MKLGGIDIGTTGAKLTIYDEHGTFLNREYVEYEISRSSGEHEIDANVIWNGIKNIIINTTNKLGNIDLIGVTSFGEAFVLLDKDDNILFPTMLYTDPRGGEEASVFDAEYVKHTAGIGPHSMYSLPKLMWVKKHHPQVYDKTDKILLIQDFIVYMLSGARQIDYSLATRTLGFDIERLEWRRDIFETAGIDVAKMSTPVEAGTTAGKIRPQLEAELGLSNTIIATGAQDQIAAAVGAGALSAGVAVDGSGTVECVTPVYEGVPTAKLIYDEGFAVVPYVKPNLYATYSLSYAGGSAVKWFRDNLASEISYRELDGLIDDGVGEIFCLPYFSGAANPYMDIGAKASFIGVTLEHTRADLYKAVLEGVAYEMRLNLSHLAEAGIIIDKLYATGGGSASPIWMQIKANILGVPITKVEAPEVGALGTIMLCGVKAGIFKSLEAASDISLSCGKTYYPNPERTKEYDTKFEQYKKIYSKTRELV